MAISVFELLTIGIGPSSSHPVGPMRAARRFVVSLDRADLERTTRVYSQLFGSLGAIGHGHGSDKAVILGLQGEAPDEVDCERVDEMAGLSRPAAGCAWPVVRRSPSIPMRISSCTVVARCRPTRTA
jgi:L-serine dehydratase